MAGTKAGGIKAARSNKLLNPDFYKIIGRKGGKNGTGANKGFAQPHRRASASAAGRKGGKVSRRNKASE